MKRLTIVLSAAGILVGVLAILQLSMRTEPQPEPQQISEERIEDTVEGGSTIDVIAPTAEVDEEIEAENPKDYYHLATMGEMLALFDESGTVVEVYEIYTHILPPEDVQQLNIGIKIENEQQLRQLLEDFGG